MRIRRGGLFDGDTRRVALIKATRGSTDRQNVPALADIETDLRANDLASLHPRFDRFLAH